MEVNHTHFAPGSAGLLMPLMPFLEDKSVSEILINQPNEVFVERQGQLQRHVSPELTFMHLKRLFLLIAKENGQVLDEFNPMLSGNLYDGSRVQLVIPPVSKHYTLAIRRKSVKKMHLKDYKHSPFYDLAKPFDSDLSRSLLLSDDDKALIKLYHQKRWAEFIELAIMTKKNIVISGETSSGKTTFLNACVSHIPKEERIITLEDTFEIKAPHLNQVALKAHKKLTNTKALVSMQDLVQCSLRLRPDRIIMGEVRGAELLDFISSCSTGHDGAITTIHAPNPKIAFLRMIQLYKFNALSMTDKDISQILHAVIDVILQVKLISDGRCLKYVYYKHASKGGLSFS